MIAVCVSRNAVASVLAAVLLAACGGSQPPIGAPGVTPQGRATAPRGDRSGSWMLPEARNEDLVYAVGGCGGTCVFVYPSGKYVGQLIAYGSAVCSDDAGNVFIPNQNVVLEYAHGGTTPIATLSLPGSIVTGGCSVDPTTHNLAVMAENNYGNIAIFPNGQGQATIYSSMLESNYVAYDNDGNLFVDGNAGQAVALAELPRGSSTFRQISVPQDVNLPGQLQWDGSYLAWESGEAKGPRLISRLSVYGSQASVVSKHFFHGFNYASQVWIYKNTVVVPYAHGGVSPRKIGIWEYPKLRKLKIFDFNGQGDGFTGVTVSVAPSH